MAKEKISDANKKVIANMNLRGKQFEQLSNLLGVSEATTRKANRIGGLLNKIDDLELENRSKEVQIMLLKSQRSMQINLKNKRK